MQGTIVLQRRLKRAERVVRVIPAAGASRQCPCVVSFARRGSEMVVASTRWMSCAAPVQIVAHRLLCDL
jgi:hypothetical protein